MEQDPFSKNIRKFIPHREYERQFNIQQDQSLLGAHLDMCTESDIKNRIAILNELEEQFGFVYTGENQWLKSYVNSEQSTRSSRYHEWVTKVFEQHVGLIFDFVEYSSNPDMPHKAWKALLENPKHYLPVFNELQNPAYEPISKIDAIEIWVFGSLQNISPPHLCRAFEYFFDFPYVLASMSQDNRGYAPLSIDGIEVTNPGDPAEWELNVRSEYGAQFNQTIKNRRAVGYDIGY